MGFVSYRYLLLLISGQTFEVTVALKIFWNLNKALSAAKKSQICSGWHYVQNNQLVSRGTRANIISLRFCVTSTIYDGLCVLSSNTLNPKRQSSFQRFQKM